MKLVHLLSALGLVAALTAGCNTGEPIQGCERPGLAFNPCSGLCAPTPFMPRCSICENDPLACSPTATAGGTGGTGGTAGGGGGGGGGGADGACTNAEDTATYGDLTYVNASAATLMGPEAASSIATECVFGSVNSEPRNPGCPSEANAVLMCAATGCPPETVSALATCVVECQQTLIEDVTGSRLTGECAACYGESVACSANLCATSGCANPTSPTCIQCRCDNNCTPGFDECSGLPSSGDCG